MTHVIRIDAEVYQELQKQAVPFEDNPNSVLRRILNLSATRSKRAPRLAEGVASNQLNHAKKAYKPLENGSKISSEEEESDVAFSRGLEEAALGVPGASKAKRRRLAKNTILPLRDYELPILSAIAKNGGTASVEEVAHFVGKELTNTLKQPDWEQYQDGRIRWHCRLQWARLRLKETGDLDPESKRGVWKISPKGVNRLTQSRVGYED